MCVGVRVGYIVCFENGFRFKDFRGVRVRVF